MLFVIMIMKIIIHYGYLFRINIKHNLNKKNKKTVYNAYVRNVYIAVDVNVNPTEYFVNS
jgi:hypothetical protein